MFCEACRRYRSPWQGRSPAFCDACGNSTVQVERPQLDIELIRFRYLLGALSAWSDASLIDRALADRLGAPYAEQLEVILHHLDDREPAARPAAPACHAAPELAQPFCPDCGVNLAVWRSQQAAPPVESSPIDAPPVTLPPVESPPVESPPVTLPPVATPPVAVPLAARVAAADQPDELDTPAPRHGRLLRELRPVFYENLLLFVGAFLMFAGSIYFAVYFWDRFGQLGPLVAGGLLAVYGLGFAAVGYLLQRRYRAELSARVLYGVATAILPVAATLLGAPIRGGGLGIAALAAGIVLAFGAIAYPAIYTAASLFQRDIGRPFARSFVALLWATGLVPVVAASGVRGLAILYVYLAALPVLAMYRRVREVGRVFERATVIYVVGGTSYLLAAVAVRMALAADGGIAPAELAPLLVLAATAAIDLDVAWRGQSFAMRSTLGAVGVVAHAAAILAIALASTDPIWRVVTTLSAGLVFGVAALRHRRPSAVHLAIATTAAGLALLVWVPAADPPHGVALGGLLLLPLSAGLARLGARWRRHAALEFAAPCELWAMLCTGIAALGTALPALGGAPWRLAALGRWSAYVPALVVLPAAAAVLALGWSWGHRRSSLAASAIAAAAAALVATQMAGAGATGLAMTSAVLTLAIAGAAALRGRRDPSGARPALLDAALAVLATAVVLLAAGAVGPWHEVGAATSALAYALLACAAIAVAAQRPRRELGVLAVLAIAVAATAALWPIAQTDLIPGILALGLLALDRAVAGRAIGGAQPFRDTYPVALAALAVQVIAMMTAAAAVAPAEPLGPIAPILVAIALIAIAARHASPWPSYAAVGCLVLAAYCAPAALDLAVAPRAVAEGAVLLVIVAALALRGRPRLRELRTTFLDVPLHLAAAAAPLALLRFAGTFAIWESEAAPQSYLVLRRLAPALGFAVLGAISHGSRVHAYLAAAAAAFILPAALAALGLGGLGDLTNPGGLGGLGGVTGGAVVPALAAGALLALIGARAIARSPRFARSVARGDLPLPLFGAWPLPSAETHGELWEPPIRQLGLVAALAAGAIALPLGVLAWSDGSPGVALTSALLAGYAIARGIRLGGDARRALHAASHAACAALAGLCLELAQLLGHPPGRGGIVALGAGFLVAGEAVARSRHAAAAPAARAALIWAIGALVLPVTALVRPTEVATPIAAALLAVAVIRHGQHHPFAGLRTTGSITTSAAGGFAVLWLLGLAGWLDPAAVALAALAATAALAGWAHWWLRGPARLGEPFGLASAWAGVGSLLAVASGALDAPPSAPAALPVILAAFALALATAWFGFAAIRRGQDRYGHAALIALLVLYLCVRTSPLGAALSLETDAIVAIAAAFALHFASELLRRAGLAALDRPAALAARILPLVACVIAISLATAGQGELATLPHAAFAGAIGTLYTLAARRPGHRALGLAAIAFFNAGLAMLSACTDRRDPLYYVIPVGLSIALLARIYRDNMSRRARRWLRAGGALLIYFTAYYRVVQFDHGVFALLLGGFTLVGIAAGFLLQLRELFVLSIGFLVLDVTSNLAYYGAHRPVLGWTLLTLAGLCLTVSGVVFQLRRAQVRSLVSGVRATLAAWD